MPRHDNSGISTIMGAILILGLLISIAAVVKITYVPDLKKQLEAGHMQNVMDDFSSFKAQLDTMQAMTASGNGYAETSRFEMGGGGIPGIDPSTTAGTLTLDPGYGALNVTAYYLNGTVVPARSKPFLGHLIYQSNNRYFADQRVGCEGGMIVLSQPSGSVMLSSPSLLVYRDQGDPFRRPVIVFNPQRLNGTYQTLSTSAVTAVRTSLAPPDNIYTSTNVTNVTITLISDYASIWATYFNSTLSAAGLVSGTNYNVTMPNATTAIIFVRGDGPIVGLYMTDSLFNGGIGSSGSAGPLVPPPTVTPTVTPTPTPTPAPLHADFSGSPTSGPAMLQVAFSDLSTGSPGSWSWSFGDGTPNMTTQSGSHTFAAPGNYTVALTVYNATTHCTTQKVNYITVVPIVADFSGSPTAGASPLTVSFTDLSTGGPTAWQWNFSDGTPNMTAQNGAHTFLKWGTYNVTLTASNSGTSGSITRTGYITVVPLVANFSGTPIAGATPLTVSFTDLSTGGPTAWQWSFGDSTANMTAQNGTHTFTRAGTYAVSLTVTNAGGSSGLRRAGYITVSNPALSRFTITASSPWTGTAADQITVTAYDQFNNVYTGYTGKVYFRSNVTGDSFTYYNSGHAYTFIAADYGTHVFLSKATLMKGTPLPIAHLVTVRSTAGSINASVVIVY